MVIDFAGFSKNKNQYKVNRLSSRKLGMLAPVIASLALIFAACGSSTTTVTVDSGAGVTVGSITGNTTEGGGAATFPVVLDKQPTADVVINVTSSNTGERTVSAASLTFTSANWSTAQIVMVTGVDDAIVDGDIAYTIVLAAATSTDSDYNDIDPADVSIINTDDDGGGRPVWLEHRDIRQHGYIIGME